MRRSCRAWRLRSVSTRRRRCSRRPLWRRYSCRKILLQDPEEYSQDLEADSLEELQYPEEAFQLEEAWPEALELMAQTVTASTLTTCSFE